MTLDNPGIPVEAEDLAQGNQQNGYPELSPAQLTSLNNVINQHAIVSITDVAGRITYANEKFCELSGYTQEELLGQNHRIIKSSHHSKAFFQKMWSTLVQGETWQGLLENRTKDGSPYWVQTTITPVLDARGKPQQYISIRTDVSPQVYAQRELQHFKHTLDKTLDSVFIFDAHTLNITYANRGAVEQVGYGLDELHTMTPVDFKPEMNETDFRQMIASLQNGDQPSITFETVHAHKCGKRIPVEIFLQYLPGEDTADQFIGVVRDISERRRMNQALESLSIAKPGNNVFDDIAQTITKSLGNRWTGICLNDENNKTTKTIGFWNDGQRGEPFTYELAGTPCDEVCTHTQPLCIEDKVADRYPLDTMLADIGAISYRGEPLVDHEGNAIGVLWVIDDKPCKDLTAERALLRIASKRATLELERMNSEKLLAERNELLHNTLERISDGFFSLDLDWNFTFVNNTAALVINSSLCNLEGQNIWDALPEMASFFFKPLKKSMKTQQAVHQEGFYPPLDIWLKMHAYPSTMGISVYFHDISEQKRLEQDQHKMEQRIQRAQKMEAVGQLTAGIAHDFNNILTSVMGYTELAQSRCNNEEQDKLAGYLQQVYQASERGRDLVLQMLSFSRKGRVNAMPIDPLPLVDETIKMLRSTLPASIDISIDVPSDGIPDISISEVQLQQVIMNICLNARDAMHDKGLIALQLRIHPSHEFTCSSCHQIATGEFVELVISDSGEGIGPYAMQNLFEPFYTTKEVGKGTGLGLSIVHGIIHEHGGHIKVESRPNKGCKFHLFFPAINTNENNRKEIHNTDLSDPVKELTTLQRILVVDDEQALINFLKEVLENEGFEVEGYSDSQDALADFKQDPHRFDLVITDLTMPNLTGNELAYEIRKLRDDIPIMLCSGYNNGLATESMPKHKLNNFLPKPFNRDTLLSHINELFNTQGDGR